MCGFVCGIGIGGRLKWVLLVPGSREGRPRGWVVSGERLGGREVMGRDEVRKQRKNTMKEAFVSNPLRSSAGVDTDSTG